MSDQESFVALVLAAGQGKRMKSQLPKVLHPLLGRPMVCYPVDAALGAGAERVVCVVGHGAERVTKMLNERYGERVPTALQPEQRGTGDAARCGLSALPGYHGWIAIVYGDSVLITSETIAALVEHARASNAPLALLTATIPDATGYGRIVRDDAGRVVKVQEERDCSPAERAIREFNPGVYVVRAGFLRDALGQLRPSNAQGELYLTDLVAMAAESGGAAALSWVAADLHGINDRHELVQREQDLARRVALGHITRGVTIRDPEHARIEPTVQIEQDAVIESNVELRGKTSIGRGARIDVGAVLTDTRVLEDAHVLPYTVATESVIGPASRVGPFSHLRPGSELGREVHLGAFVETKKTQMGEGSKANHLAYLGDGVIGRGVNVGAGTIFCNYDGVNKHTTTLEDGVFIGSDSQLVAPVTVGKDAYVASGTTVTEDVPADALAIGRARQVNKPGFAARLRERFLGERQRAGAPKSPKK
ncbi:MAG: bifunctional UDP-N-acetylglucosamine diphosphorylase/glucosamine-1-phosphate N-acetyltransferase GlmU [Polyangiales bacterium]